MSEQRGRARADAAAKRATVTVSDLPTRAQRVHRLRRARPRAARSSRSWSTARRSSASSRATNAQLILDRTVVLRREGRPDRRPRRDRRRRGGLRRDRHPDTRGEAIVHHGVVRRGAFAVGDAVETLVVSRMAGRDSPPSHLGPFAAARAARRARRRGRASRLVGRRRPHALRLPQSRRRAERASRSAASCSASTS